MNSIVGAQNNLFREVNKQLADLKNESRKLEVRLLTVERFLKLSVSENEVESDEFDEVSELISNIEAVKYDLSTYQRQLKDRIAHVERGLSVFDSEVFNSSDYALLRYIEEDVRLCLRDVVVAREGYDELIENLRVLRHMRDNDL